MKILLSIIALVCISSIYQLADENKQFEEMAYKTQQFLKVEYGKYNIFPKSLVNLKPAVREVSNQNVEKVIRSTFRDAPVMVAIAKCESSFRQYEPDGSGPLKNKHGSSAIGAMQIMYSVHKSEIKKLGLDVTTLEGNLAFAKHLYSQSGTKPWTSSQHCWDKTYLALK